MNAPPEEIRTRKCLQIQTKKVSQIRIFLWKRVGSTTTNHRNHPSFCGRHYEITRVVVIQGVINKNSWLNFVWPPHIPRRVFVCALTCCVLEMPHFAVGTGAGAHNFRVLMTRGTDFERCKYTQSPAIVSHRVILMGNTCTSREFQMWTEIPNPPSICTCRDSHIIMSLSWSWNCYNA